MLRSIQLFGTCSGFVFHRLKHRYRTPLLTISRTNLCCRQFRASSIRPESNSDVTSASASSSPTFRPTDITRKINFCQICGGPTKHVKPDGDEKERAVCTLCGKVSYENPKMVVGCLIEHDNKILLCKRNIQPSYGLWTLPAGYMEIGESATEGAIRETWEEAGAKSYLIFLAKMMTPHYSPGPESLECRFFALDDIPYESLSFSSMLITLKLYIEDVKVGKPKFHYGLINKRPGTSPSEIHAYTFDYHLRT